MIVKPLESAPDAPLHPLRPPSAISQRIADFCSPLHYDEIPQKIRNCAKHHILDVIGTALAATRFDFTQHALAGLLGIAEGGHNSIIGMGAKMPLRDAVLLNGILAHGLDYDDTHPAAIVHPTSSTFPCALGVGEFLDSHGRDLLTAYILGVDIATRVGIAAKGLMHTQGFHTTGIAGHFACAIVAGKLFNLNPAKLVMAQGLAGSTTSAMSEHRADGAWNKRMHPGWAAVGGITAASLARGGFVGTRKIYEGSDGLFRSHTGSMLDKVDLDAMTRNLGEQWHIEEVAIKPYPICHLLHACADSALAIRTKHKVKFEDIKSVRALLHPETFHYVAEPAEMRRRPMSDYMAKFSVQYVIAACFVRGQFGFSELETDALNDPAILALAQRVSHVADPDSAFPKYFSGGAIVTLKDGQEFVHMEKINRGAGDRALTDNEIVTKFMENAALAVSRPCAEHIQNIVLDLENHCVRELGRALTGQ